MKNNFVYLLLYLIGNTFGLWAQTNPLNPVIYPAFNGTNTGAIEQTLPPSVAGVEYFYHWFKEGVGPEIGNTLNIYHLTPGNYTLHMSRAGWCSPAKYNYTIPSATNMGIQIYPNPATNQLTASGHPTTGKHYLTLHDVTGRTVLQQPLQTGDTNLSIVHLPTGLYVYEIRNEQNELLGADKLTIIR